MSIEYEFLVKHSLDISKKYRGEWIAVVGEEIVAHGKEFKEVAEQAKKVAPNPLFDKVQKEDVVIYGYRISIS